MYQSLHLRRNQTRGIGIEMAIKRALARVLSRPVWWTLHNYRILSLDFAQFKTIRRRESIDKYNQPIPWYTYPAIEYIKQLDVSDKTVFEYGSGNSTLFWAQRSKTVVAVEDNAEWYEKLRNVMPSNVEYHLLRDEKEYVNAIERYPFKFGLIAIDGSHRYECAQAAVRRLKSDGLIILDNSDWRERTSQLLRDADLIEVDMSGFGPINPYTWTTSFYLSRQVNLRPAHTTQPVHGVGAQRQWEADQVP
jgi:hypothetical protein